VEFDFDPIKSQSNKENHGIDFFEAQLLRLDSMLLVVPSRTVDEPRFLVIGKIGSRHWSGVLTYCEGKARIISVRLSRKEELGIYEGL